MKTRAPRGTDHSPEYNEHFCYKLRFKGKQETAEDGMAGLQSKFQT